MKENFDFNTEAEAAGKEAEEFSGNMTTLELRRPFTYEGKTYTKLQFDWDRLTGLDSLAVERELANNNVILLVPSINGDYLLRIAARACTERVGFDMLAALPLFEYNAIRGAARNFLNHAE